jgi:hypothetical protein
MIKDELCSRSNGVKTEKSGFGYNIKTTHNLPPKTLKNRAKYTLKITEKPLIFGSFADLCFT